MRLYGLRHLRNDDAARDLAQQVLLSFILGMSRLMTKDLKRQEWRREKLREAFIPPSAFTVDVEDAHSTSTGSRRVSRRWPSATARSSC